MKKMRASGDRAEESDGGRSAAAVDPSDTALAHGDDLPVRGGSNCGVASNCEAKLRRIVEIAELGHMSVDKAIATLMAIRGNRGAAAVLSYLKGYGDRVADFTSHLEKIGFNIFDADLLWRALQSLDTIT